VSGDDDAPEPVHVDMHELARRGALVADDLLASHRETEARAAVPTQDRVHGRSREPECPPDHMRSLAQLLATTQDRPLDTRRRDPTAGSSRATSCRITSETTTQS
jgi:hypothetical protein